MANILLVEDEVTNQKLVQTSLSEHHVAVASTLAEARTQIASKKFDFLILDVQLPDGDGFSFYLEIQAKMAELEIPVVFLTGRNEIADKVTGYSLGADDYITKPIHPLEFKARIEAKLKKFEAKKGQSTVYKKHGFTFHLEKQNVAYNQDGAAKSLDLTTMEFKLFLFLIKNEDKVLSREILLSEVWGGNLSVGDRTIDTHVSHLRKRLAGTPLSIQSVYGAGYRMSEGAKLKSA